MVKRVSSKKSRRSRAKQPSISLDKVLARLNNGEAHVIGLEAQKDNKKAQAVIAQYVWYLKYPQDPERIRLLCLCYEQYEKAKALAGRVIDG